MRISTLCFSLAAALLAACSGGSPLDSASVPGATSSVAGGSGAPGPLAAPPSVPGVPPKPRLIVWGQVLDAANQGIADAIVSVQGTEFRTWTDKSGRFGLAVDPALRLPAVVTAAAPGFYNGGIDALDLNGPWQLRLQTLPSADPKRTEFMRSDSCKNCHQNIYAEWQSSRMARTGMNRWVHDLLDGTGTAGGQSGFVYQRDSVHRKKSPNGDCSSCHTPNLSHNHYGASMGNLASPSWQKTEGVGCDVCHKMVAIDVKNANYPGVHPKVVTFHQPQSDLQNPIVFGSLADSTFRSRPMFPAYSEVLASGHLVCATCHEDNIDHDHDGEYEDAGSIEAQSTYSEWRASPYAKEGVDQKTCVTCHMPVTKRDRVASIQGIPGRTVRSHAFPGFKGGGQAGASEMKLSSKRLPGGAVEVSVELLNKGAGHSLPTGVFLRNYLLVVEATQKGLPLPLQQGSTLDRIAGVGDPAKGYYNGLPGKVYAKVLEDAQGAWPVYQTEAAKVRYDTRIPATKSDQQVFRFGARPGEVQVRARLIYRKAFRVFVDMKGWTTDGLGGVLWDIQAPHYGKLVHEKVQKLP